MKALLLLALCLAHVCEASAESTSKTSDAEIEQLVEWMRSRGAVMDGFSIGRACRTCMRGLIATKNFKAGEVIMSVPVTATLRIKEFARQASYAEYARDLLERMHRYPIFNETWKVYWRSMPGPGELFSSELFTDEHIKMLQTPELERIVEKDRSLTTEMYYGNGTAQPPGGYKPLADILPGVSLDTFKHVTSLVRSRYFNVRVDNKRQQHLLPVFDMVNHADAANAIVTDGSHIKMAALQPIKKGQEIFWNYNTALRRPDISLKGYGFVIPRDPPLLPEVDLPRGLGRQADDSIYDEPQSGYVTQEELTRLTGLLEAAPTTVKEDQALLEGDTVTDWRELAILQFRVQRKLALRLNIDKIAAALGNDVVTVSGEEQLDALVSKHAFVAVDFSAPWCIHCKRLEPEWAKAATALKLHDPEIVLAKVDATSPENAGLKSKYSIRSYPTIKIFKGGAGQPQEYEGPRDRAGIAKHLKKQAKPYALLERAEAIVAAREEADPTLVLAFLASSAFEDFRTFAEVAEALRNDMDFAYVTNSSVIKECAGAACSSPTVILYTKGETETPRYQGAFQAAPLKTWAITKSQPPVIRFGSPVHTKLVEKDGGRTHLVAMAPEGQDSAELLQHLQEAKKGHDALAVILASGTQSKSIVDLHGIKVDGSLTLLLEDRVSKAKYLKRNCTPSDIPDFVRKYKEGALSKWVKSEEPPVDNNGPVRVVVGKTLDAEVFKSGTDVFVDIYAPWCGHCKKLGPTWEELGKAFQGDDSVVIAKIDATANDISSPKLLVKGYPTLYFVTARGEVREYDGKRTKDELAKFVRENCTRCKKARKKVKKEKRGVPAEDARDDL